MDTPGKEGTTFKLLLNPNAFKKNDIIESSEGVELKVLSTPTIRYNKWYWKILNWLTFKYFFNVDYTYTVKIIEDDNT
jgi:hypothetical protein